MYSATTTLLQPRHPAPASRSRCAPTRTSAAALPLLLSALLLLAHLPTRAAAFSFTTPPPRAPTGRKDNNNPFVQTIEQRIFEGQKALVVRPFVKIPDFKNVGSKIVGIVPFGQALYLTTSTSGAYIYKVHIPTRTVRLWFDLGTRVRKETGGEREVNCDNTAHGGLRGIAFPPDFWSTGLFYTSYVETAPKDRSKFRYVTPPKDNSFLSDSVVVEWRYNFGANTVQWGSYRVVLRIQVPVFDHPIKQITFQKNLLLVTHGDASVQSSVGGGGLNNDALGKILRIDPRKQPNGAPYGIPPDNPFLANPNFPNEAYAVGFRNPHTICLSRADGTIFTTDAGRDNAEEVNIVVKGGNYGWPKREGTFVHLAKVDTGTGEGVAFLPPNDAQFGFRYPNAQVGHYARKGSIFQGQAIAGGCPIENSSPLSGTYWYTNFPSNGQMYYSWVGALKRAVVTGPPQKIRTANLYTAKVVYERPGLKPLYLDNFQGVIAADGFPGGRADVRLGQGPGGEMYVSSKTTGRIYVVANSFKAV